MSNPSSRSSLVVALYVNAALLGAILVVLVVRGGGARMVPSALGQTPTNVVGGNGLYVMPAQFSINTWGCYVLDVNQRSLVAYEYYPGDNQLRLKAARDFEYDLMLQSYDTTPAPPEVQRMVDEQRRARTGGPATRAAGPEVVPGNQP